MRFEDATLKREEGATRLETESPSGIIKGKERDLISEAPKEIQPCQTLILA